MKTTILKLTTLTLLMLVTGVFWGTWFTLTRSIEQFSAAEFIHIGKVIIANIANPMRFIMPASILGLLLVTWRQNRSGHKSFYFMLASLVLIIATLLITLLVEVPIDNELKTWTEATVPSNWEAIREKWAYYHQLRTFTSLGAFICFGVGYSAWEAYKLF